VKRCLRILLPVLLLFPALFSQAQYITIPDTALLRWFNNNGYSNCINGNQLDTLCADTVIVNQNPVNLSGLGLTNLTGLRVLHWYYNGGGYNGAIDLSNNKLTSLQPDLIALMSEMISVNLDYNLIDTLNLDSLINHGGGFDNLSAQHNGMHAVRTGPMLFNNMAGLFLDYNNLDSIPNFGGNTLWSLSIRHNRFTRYPSYLWLNSIDCGANFIDSIALGPYDGTLICDSNLLHTINAEGLYYLDCHANQITSIINTGYWPLGYLNCSYNRLTGFDSLSAGLNRLVANNNNLTSLPQLSTNMVLLNVNNNPNLQCVPDLPNVTNFELDYQNTGIQCLPRQFPNCVYTGTPGINYVPTCNNYTNPYSCPQYANFGGYAYLDTSITCTYSPGMPQYTYVKAMVLRNDSVIQQAYTDYTGHYSFNEISYGPYQLKVDTTFLPFSLICPDSFYYTANVDSQELYQSGFNFGFTCKPGFDVGVQSIGSNFWFHPRQVNTVYIGAGDMAELYGMHCASGISGQVVCVYNGPITYLGPAQGALTPIVTGDTLIWNIADFGYINNFSAFNVLFVTDTQAQQMAPVCFTARVTPVTGDNNPTNNTATWCSNVLIAWDPNGKEAYPSGKIDISQRWLTYTIRFKNTGAAAATNIYVLDTLSNYLDASSFQLAGFNHTNSTQILPGGIVRFNFNNINLPDSSISDTGSCAFIQYRIKIKAGTPRGTIINNTASVYFDFNNPVQTSIATDTILDTACITVYHSIADTICAGDTIFMWNKSLTNAGGYTDTATSIAGCDSIINLYLYLTQRPVPDINIPYPKICSGQATFVNYTGNPYVSLNASFDSAVIISGGNNPPYYVEWLTGGTKQVAFTVSNGFCTATVHDSVIVTQVPTTTFTLSDTIICAGLTDTLVYTGNAPSGATFIYSLGRNYNLTDTGSYPRYLTLFNSGYQAITLQVINNGCAGPPDTAYVNVKALPGFYPGHDIDTCAHVVIDTLGGTPVAGYTYRWSPPVGLSDTTIPNPIAIVTNYADTPLIQYYGVTVSDNECSGTYGVGIELNTPPVISITKTCVPDHYNTCFAWSVLNAFVPLGDSMQWSLNGNLLDTINSYAIMLIADRNVPHPAQNPQITVPLNTPQIVCVTAYNTCGPYTTCDTITLTVDDIKEITNYPTFTVYPNPSAGNLLITTQNFTAQTINIYDATGRLINTLSFKKEIDIIALSSGVYFVEVKGSEGAARRRLVKM